MEYNKYFNQIPYNVIIHITTFPHDNIILTLKFDLNIKKGFPYRLYFTCALFCQLIIKFVRKSFLSRKKLGTKLFH